MILTTPKALPGLFNASLINHFGCVAVLFSHHRDINCSTNFLVCVLWSQTGKFALQYAFIIKLTASLINHFGYVAALFSYHTVVSCSTNFPVCGVYDGNYTIVWTVSICFVSCFQRCFYFSTSFRGSITRRKAHLCPRNVII